MKASSIALLLFASTAATTLAQTSQVPELLSYQASVTNAAGTPIGATEPVNRTVTFKFYTTSTGGTPVYAESQVVTIANGDFSVLLGNGEGVSGLPGRVAPASPIRSLASITLSPLYLGITVDDGTTAVDAEISPRQQLASAAFATRAQIAEGLAAGKLATGMVADSAITTVKIGSNQITTAKIANSNITTAKLATGSVTLDKLDTSAIGVWTPNGPNINRTSGNVGIGEINPNVPLNFKSELGNKISLWGNSASAHYGFGIQGNLLQLYTAASVADVAFGYGSSTAFTETMRIRGNGNLGIGTTAPTSKLHVNGGNATIDSTQATALSVLRNGGVGQLNLGLASATGIWSSSAATNDGVLRAINGKLHLQSGSGAAAITIDAANNVGLGTNGPNNKLDVRGKLSLGDAFPDSFYNGALQITRPSSAAQHINLVRSGIMAWSMGYVPNSSDFGIGAGTSDDASFNPKFRIDTIGRVGINTVTPGVPLDVGSSTRITMSDNYYSGNTGTNIAGNTWSSSNALGGGGIELYSPDGIGNLPRDIKLQADVGIRAAGWIVTAKGFAAYSDRRIKRDVRASSQAGDLAAIEQLKVTDYRMVDPDDGDTSWRKGFLAQEVEAVIPGAVSHSVNFVPDIFVAADAAVYDANTQTLSVRLAKEHALKAGQRVRLHTDSKREDLIVSEVVSSHEFVVDDCSSAPEQVFVYGSEVSDFSTLDYDRIYTTSVGAIQELSRKVQAGESENAALKTRQADLETRLAALEKLIQTGN